MIKAFHHKISSNRFNEMYSVLCIPNVFEVEAMENWDVFCSCVEETIYLKMCVQLAGLLWTNPFGNNKIAQNEHFT